MVSVRFIHARRAGVAEGVEPERGPLARPAVSAFDQFVVAETDGDRT
jgi:hypothetical protein